MDKNFNFKKKYGQNFLKDENILNKIVNSCEVNDKDLVIEIGPGAGALTEKLLEKTKKVICFEIDTDLKDLLKPLEINGANIIYGDFLEQDVNKVIKEYKYNNLFIIANLPYYITTPIINKIIDDKLPVNKCVFMIQKEVADRFKASVGTKQYNSLSIFIDYYFEVNKLFDVSRNSFFPVPNVDSTVISLEKRSHNKVNVKNEDLFFKLVRDAFKFKRKTIKNNLKNYNLNIVEAVLKKYNMSLQTRAEAISIEIFKELVDALS